MTEPEHHDDETPSAPNFIELLEADEELSSPGLCVPFR